MSTYTEIDQSPAPFSIKPLAPKLSTGERKNLVAIKAEIDAVDLRFEELNHIQDALNDGAFQFARGLIDLPTAISLAGSENTSENRNRIAQPLRKALKEHQKDICNRSKPLVEAYLESVYLDIVAKHERLVAAEKSIASELGIQHELSAAVEKLERNIAVAQSELSQVRNGFVNRSQLERLIKAAG